MKTRFSAILTFALLILSVSCGRNKGMFVLQGTVQDNTDSILVVGLDSRFVDVDTIFCTNGQFKWSFRPDTATTLILMLPDGRRFPVFAQKDVQSTLLIPDRSGLFNISGGEYNDSYQAFYLASIHDTLMEQTAARIDSFITRDPFSEVTPYLIYDCMVRKYHAGEKDIEALIKRMSGNMQDAPYLVSLKAEFEKTLPTNTYIDTYTVKDSAGYSYRLIDMGGTVNHMLICVWASWLGDEGLKARDTLSFFLDKYADRSLDVSDISIDVNPKLWKETISKDTVNWFSYIDPKGWESNIVKKTSLQTVPAFILLTGVKRVIYKTYSIEDMDQELSRVLPKPDAINNNNRRNVKPLRR